MTLRAQRARRTVGYLATFSDGDASQPQWSGVVDAARDRDVNLICFLGRNWRSPIGFEAQANILYDLVSAEGVDGLVSWASSIGNFVTADAIRILHERYHPLPMTTIGRTLEGIPGLLIENYHGMRNVIRHLIETHECRRLVFICGPEHHLYAQERFRAYRETLSAYQIPFDPNLVTPCSSWEFSWGVEAMRLLVEERRLRPQVDFQAIVAANDHLLLGALEFLQTRGVRAPDAVAAVGFNDTLHGRTNIPPLTTIAVPFYHVGYDALETVLAQLAGQSAPALTVAPTQLVIRQSCGCLDRAVAQAVCDPTQVENGTQVLDERRDGIRAALTQALGELSSRLLPGWDARLLDAWLEPVRTDTSGKFLHALNDLLVQTITSGEPVSVWHGAISAMRQQLAPLLRDGALRRAENMWHQARVMIGDTARRQSVNQALQTEQQDRILREIGTALIAIFDVESLMNELSHSLPRLGIPGCYLSLYENPEPAGYPCAVPEWSRLMLAFSEKGRINLEPGGHRFRSRQLVPADILPKDKRFTLVAEALYFQNNQLGFVLFEAGSSALRSGIYATLRAQISNALQGALLLQERQRVKAALETSRTQLRTIADSLPVLIAQIDTEHRYLFANQAFQAWLGIAPDRVIGKQVREVLGEERYQVVVDPLTRALTGTSLEIDQNLVYKASAVRFVHSTYIPHFNEQGQVDSCFELSSDITVRKEMERQLEFLATTDALTGLNNRRYFMERSRDEIRQAKRYGTFLSLLIFDVDYFKQVNDSYGHDAGDRALQKLTAVLRSILRDVDLVARIGGEEFSVLLTNTLPEGALVVAERLRRCIEEAVFEAGSTRFSITVSIGVAFFNPQTDELGTLLKHADLALYQAKSGGRNCVVAYAEPE